MTVPQILAWLERRGTKRNREGMARYAIVAPKVFGVSVARPARAGGKTIGRDQKLAEALWKTGWCEARMLVGFVADPARVTPAQMDRWARDFDNWAICDHPVLPPLRSHAARVAEDRAVEPQPRRVREARGLRAPRERRAARQERARRAVPRARCLASSAPPATSATS